jgi:TatD DNase family protein
LLIETDSPVLGPSHETRNEPANILQSIKSIAALKDIDETEVLAVVLENTERLYGKLFSDPN